MTISIENIEECENILSKIKNNLEIPAIDYFLKNNELIQSVDDEKVESYFEKFIKREQENYLLMETFRNQIVSKISPLKETSSLKRKRKLQDLSTKDEDNKNKKLKKQRSKNKQKKKQRSKKKSENRPTQSQLSTQPAPAEGAISKEQMMKLFQMSETQLPQDKKWRSGFAPIYAKGEKFLPIVTSLKRQGYREFYCVSLDMREKKKTREEEKEEEDEAKELEKKGIKKEYEPGYLKRSPKKTYFMGRDLSNVKWMNRPDFFLTMDSIMERKALIIRFLQITGAREYSGLSNTHNDEMSGPSFSGQGASFIEGNSRSFMLDDGYIPYQKGVDGKRICRSYLSQYLRCDPKEYKFTRVDTDYKFTEKQIDELIIYYDLQDIFKRRKEDLYPLIYPLKGDWNYKKNAVFVTDYYTSPEGDPEDDKFRKQVNCWCANMHDVWRNSGEEGQRKIESFRGLILCKGGRQVKSIPFILTHDGLFRSWNDYDPKFLEEVKKEKEKKKEKTEKLKKKAKQTKFYKFTTFKK
jgi:hypothetical protein